ncbi:MAG: roadblock/LC7 domain-containing protein [Anaerolineae bacterium]|nr:roadblock/LC7 domain-containing protein [Anaerolineae bacterium]
MTLDIVESLEEALHGLQEISPYVMGSAVVTSDGFVVASDLPSEMDEKKITVMAMAMLTLAQETMSELSASDLERVLVESKDSYIVLLNAGPDAVVAAVAEKEAVLGLLLVAMRQTVQRVEGILTA